MCSIPKSISKYKKQNKIFSERFLEAFIFCVCYQKKKKKKKKKTTSHKRDQMENQKENEDIPQNIPKYSTIWVT